jgi:hypothetical protein
MDTLIEAVCGVLFVLAVLFAVDRSLWIKEIETDLNNFLGDSLAARDVSEDSVRVHYQAQVNAIKALIRKHFKL